MQLYSLIDNGRGQLYLETDIEQEGQIWQDLQNPDDEDQY